MKILGIFFAALVFFSAHAFAGSLLEFQTDGYFQTKNHEAYAIRKVSENLENYTFCLWFAMSYERSTGSNYFLSIATEEDYNYMNLGVMFHEDGKKADVHFKCDKSEGNKISISPFYLNQFYHYCFTNELRDNGATEKKYYSRHFLNGNLSFEGSGCLFKEGSLVVLGQEQDGFGGSFEARQSFSGKLAELHLFTQVLNHRDILTFSHCGNTRSIGISNDWDLDSSSWELHNTKAKEITSEELCRVDPWRSEVYVPESLFYPHAKELCQNMGARLITIVDDLERKQFFRNQEKHLRRWSNQLPTSMDCLPNLRSDTKEPLNNFQWNSIIKVNGTWQVDRDPDVMIPQPTITRLDAKSGRNDCSGVTSEEQLNFYEKDCLVLSACFTCQFRLESRPILRLKGLCLDERLRHIDEQYHIYEYENQRLSIRGRRLSKISYQPYLEWNGGHGSFWRLQSFVDKNVTLVTPSQKYEYPFGRRNWTVLGPQICESPSGTEIELTLSVCSDNEFTCNSGQCIPLNLRCDLKIDCDYDTSDELDCHFLNPGRTYVGDIIPKKPQDPPLLITMDAMIMNVPKIDTVDSKFSVNYILHVSWQDHRLQYQNLNSNSEENAINLESMQKIWTPRYFFANALGSQQSKLDEATIGKIRLKGHGLTAGIEESKEAYQFNGTGATIVLTNEYFDEFACNFSLKLYPFDKQVCTMEIESYTYKADKFRFKAGKISQKELPILPEYDLMDMTITESVKGTHSRITIKFYFQRQIEYHIMNTFLQTLLLIFVGYLSFFFDVSKFSDRIMVTLTTMLVVATLMSSIQSNLPKTSYYKMIDWWLLFCLTTLIIMLAFHTLIGYLVDNTQELKLKKVCPKGKNGTWNLRLRELERASHINLAGKIGLFIWIILCNIVFFSIGYSSFYEPLPKK